MLGLKLIHVSKWGSQITYPNNGCRAMCPITMFYSVGGMPPRDRTRQERALQRVNLTLYIILCIIASFGIIIAALFLAINFKFSKHR